jgi:hypothetical protein
MEEVRRSTMMSIQEVVNKAVEGGYHIHGFDGIDTYYEGAHSDFPVWTKRTSPRL